MIPITQTILHDPETNAIGDCFRCCIASLLELNAEKVPHFVELFPESWWIETNKWLWMKGFFLQNYPIVAIDEDYPFLISDFHLISGKSPRGLGHTCVGKEGKIVHDPHPSRDGLVSVGAYDILFKRKKS